MRSLGGLVVALPVGFHHGDRDGGVVRAGEFALQALVVVRSLSWLAPAPSADPLTAWCTNIGDSLAVQLRPGNAGSFTASDHLAVLDAAMAQIAKQHGVPALADRQTSNRFGERAPRTRRPGAGETADL